MIVTKLKTQMHMQEWVKRIEDRQDSGLSVKQWCQQNQLLESQYYYYLRKLRVAACEHLAVEEQNGSQFALVPNRARINHSVATGCTPIKITLSNAVIEIGEGAETAQVKWMLEVLLDAQ